MCTSHALKLARLRADGRTLQDHTSIVCLSNLCLGYQNPSIVDIKIGFETTYPWASEAYNEKNRCVSRGPAGPADANDHVLAVYCHRVVVHTGRKCWMGMQVATWFHDLNCIWCNERHAVTWSACQKSCP